MVRWALTFDNAIVPILGFLFLPWTTVMYVLVFPQASTDSTGSGWGLAVLADIGSLFGGGWKGRDRYAGYVYRVAP